MFRYSQISLVTVTALPEWWRPCQMKHSVVQGSSDYCIRETVSRAFLMKRDVICGRATTPRRRLDRKVDFRNRRDREHPPRIPCSSSHRMALVSVLGGLAHDRAPCCEHERRSGLLKRTLAIRCRSALVGGSQSPQKGPRNENREAPASG
jgi:hypothetical protein